MKTITVAELRQNPTEAITEVESGEVYRITRHRREVARLVPPSTTAVNLIPPKRIGPSSTVNLPYVELSTANSVDELLEELKGEW
ncbi:MAG: type II toxin-antitoxin system Phd/YefM family antitoxin [Microbacterium sp.]